MIPASRLFSLRTLLVVIGVLLIAANLRGPMTAVAPLLDEIQHYFQLSSAATGMMTSLPLLVLAIVSPLCAGLAFRFGLERLLFAGVMLIAIGIATRSAGSLFSLFLGTALIGVGIAIGNVLLPALLKRDFPARLAVFTSAYALTMGVAAAIMSAVAIPLSHQTSYGWRFALLSSGVFALLALIVWLPQTAKKQTPSPAPLSAHVKKPLWHHPLAWQVTFFMGLNSFVYYIFISWLPAIVQQAGFSAEEAGKIHGLMQLSSAFPGIILMALLYRLKDQRGLVVVACFTELAGILGLIFYPQYSLLWSVVFGFGNGATFILALSFIGLRSSSVTQAASLSGLAQCLGYLLAAFGPSLMGWIHDLTGTWHSTLVICAVLTLFITAFGLLAGRAIQIPEN